MIERNEDKKSDDRQTDSRQRVGMRSSDGERSVASEATIKSKERISAQYPISSTVGKTTLRSRGVVQHAHASRPESARSSTHGITREKIEVETVLDQASKLTRKEAQELLDQLSLRMQITDSAIHDRELVAWCGAVSLELNKRMGSDRSYGIMTVRKMMSEPDAWRPVERFMEDAGFAVASSAQRLAMYMLLAEMLVDEMARQAKRRGILLSLKAVATCAQEIFFIFDDAFPGYLRSGLAFMVAEQQQKIATGKTSV